MTAIKDWSQKINTMSLSEDSKYRYCTECILYADNLDPKIIQEAIAIISDSVVVVGSKTKIKIHAHTNHPGQLFKMLREYGPTDHEKVEDIWQQEKDVYGDINHDIAIVTDSSCDLPEDLIEQFNVHRIPFTITYGTEVLIDRISIDDHEFYQRMKKSNDIAKTSQLGNIDLRQMYEWTSKNFNHTLAVHIAKPLNASIDRALQVASAVSDTVAVMDSKCICVGLGLIVAQVGRAITSGKNFKECCLIAEWSCNCIQQLFTVEDLKYLIRCGRLKASKGKIATLLNLKPLLHTDPTGALKPFSQAFGIKGSRKIMLKELQKRVKSKRNIHFAIGHCNNDSTALWYKEQIENIFNPLSIFITSISPTIGSYSGPGTISIAFLPEHEG